MNLDLRTITAEEAITAMMTVDGLRVEAGELRPGDRVVIHRASTGYRVGTIHSVTVVDRDRWVEIELTDGEKWQCSPRNRGVLVVAPDRHCTFPLCPMAGASHMREDCHV